MLYSENKVDLWRCKCDCGMEINIESRYIEHGATSCGLCEPYNNSDDHLIGQHIGSLEVIGRGPNYLRYDNLSYRRTYWCRCDCGNPDMFIVFSDALTRKNHTLNCGCIHTNSIFNIGKNNMIHGLSNTRLYNIYRKMIERCYDENCFEYNLYGGRGIRVCNEWINKQSYEGLINFYHWAIDNGYDDSLSIDRIDNDGNYSPYNCRWADSYIQSSNKRSNHFLQYNGENYTVAQWSKALGINSNTIYARLKRGYSIEKALTTPTRSGNINAIYFVDKFNNPINQSEIERE